MRYSFFLSLLLPFLALSQPSTPRDEYIAKAMDEIIPRCNQERDAACILHHLDSIYQWMEKDEEWMEAVRYLVWKAYYAEHYLQLGPYHQALQRTAQLLRAYPGEMGPLHDHLVKDNRVRLGDYYYKIADWPNAITTFKQLEKQLQATSVKSDEDWASLARVYRYLGVIYRSMGDFDTAHSYYRRALQCELARDADPDSSGFVAITYKHLGDLFSLKKEWPQAEQHYNRAIKTYLNTDTSSRRNINGLTTTLLGKARLMHRRGSYGAALHTLEELRRVKPGASDLDQDIYQHFGDAYSGLEKHAEAERFYRLALDKRTAIFGKRHYKVAEAYTGLGRLHASRRQWEKALAHYQQALISLCEGFDEQDISKNPEVSALPVVSMELADVLEHKLDALRQLHHEKPGGPHQRLAWETALTALDALDRLKTGPVRAEQDKLFFWEERFSLFEKAIALAAELGEDYYEKAFEIAEQSKGVVLLEAFKRANALHFAGVPDSLVELEKRLKYELAVAEDAAYRPADNAGGTDASSLARYQEAKENYYGLLSYLEKEYEDYYRLNYGRRAIPVADARRLLPRGSALLEYFVGDSTLFAFVLDGRKLELHQRPLDFPLADWVNRFRESISGYHSLPSAERSEGLFRSASEAYTYYGHRLYEKILAPFAEGLPEDIIIIPDGPLAYLSFDALLTEPADTHPERYARHPYLLFRHQASYAYSATLLEEMKRERTVSDSLLAFAPSFPESQAAGPLAIANRANLTPLSHNIPEVETILRIWGRGRRLTGTEASKQAFLALAPRQAILHIASHGVLNDSLASRSYIAFTPLAEEPDSNRLYVRGLYGLKLHAAMVVLSACEAGLGEWRRGEGIISLTRGFAYAGTQSLISTLWKVNESSTAEIMQAFYEELAGGRSKDEALRRAKLRYLERHSGDFASHPYFWAAYVPIGDTTPLMRKGYWWWIVGGLVILLVLGYFGVSVFRPNGSK